MDFGVPGTEEGPFLLTHLFPGLSGLHRERRKKNRKARAPSCSQGWQGAGEPAPPAPCWQHLVELMMIKGLVLTFASPE